MVSRQTDVDRDDEHDYGRVVDSDGDVDVDVDVDFAAFIDAFDPVLRRFIRSKGPDPEAVADIAQDVWYGFIRSLERGAIIEYPAAWLYRSARNRVIDAYRRIEPVRLGESDVDGHVSEESPEDELYLSEFFDLFEAALGDLPENQRIVFIRNEIDGVTLREIAEEEGENLKTIISRKRYAVIKLRAALGDYYEEFWGD